MKQKRLLQLDSIRFFALMIIILSHFGFLKYSPIGWFYSAFLHNPTFGVDFFFMLSGFGLFYSLHDKECPTGVRGACVFVISKIKKIYPLYLISLVLSLPYNLMFVENINLKGMGLKLLLDLTLLQSLTGQARFSHGINGVCWFISTLFVSYLFSPCLVTFVREKASSVGKAVAALCGCVALLILLSAFALHLEGVLAETYIKHEMPLVNDLFYGSPYVRIWYVLSGMLLAQLYFLLVNSNFAEKNLTFLEICLVVFSVSYFLFRNTMPLSPVVFRLVDVLNAGSILFVFAFEHGAVSRWLGSSDILYKSRGGVRYVPILTALSDCADCRCIL